MTALSKKAVEIIDLPTLKMSSFNNLQRYHFWMTAIGKEMHLSSVDQEELAVLSCLITPTPEWAHYKGSSLSLLASDVHVISTDKQPKYSREPFEFQSSASQLWRVFQN